MSFGPEKEKELGGIAGRREEYGHKIEAKEKFGIPAKGLFALAMGALWLEWKTFRDPFDPGSQPLGGELKPEDKKKVEKQGWLRTAFEKSQKAYTMIEKVEDFVNKGKGIGDLLKEGLPIQETSDKERQREKT